MHYHGGVVCVAQSQKFWREVAEFELWRREQTNDLEETTFLLELFIGLWEASNSKEPIA